MCAPSKLIEKNGRERERKYEGTPRPTIFILSLDYLSSSLSLSFFPLHATAFVTGTTTTINKEDCLHCRFFLSTNEMHACAYRILNRLFRTRQKRNRSTNEFNCIVEQYKKKR